MACLSEAWNLETELSSYPSSVYYATYHDLNFSLSQFQHL